MNVWYRLLIITLFACHSALFYACSEERNVPDASSQKGQEPASPEPRAVKQVFRTIPAAEAKAMIEKREDLVIVDVRTPQERRQIRIANSQLIPVGDVVRGKLEFSTDKPIILVCAVGGRSYFAGKALVSMGYREIYNLGGGLDGWRRAGFPLEQGPE